MTEIPIGSRTVVITGSASGIGAATRTALIASGCQVIGVDLHDAEILADLATVEGREHMIREVRRLAPAGLHGLVANAAVLRSDELAVRLNYFGAVATLTGLRPLLLPQQGRAVVVASRALLQRVVPELLAACLAGQEANAVHLTQQLSETDRQQVYATSKRALGIWLRQHASAADWAGAGLTLNAVAPGMVETPMMAPALATPELRAEALSTLPMPLGGVARPEEISTVIGWFLSAENSKMTGQVVFVDGGGETLMRPGDIWKRTTPET